MNVYLLKDVEKIGMAGEIVKVADGYAGNYLLPRKLAIQITEKNQAHYAAKVKTVEKRKEVISSKTSMLAERIGSMTISVKRKMHDDGKLYGAINSNEVVEALAKDGVAISKSQVVFDKAVKEKGTHKVTIKLSSRLQPTITIKVLPE